MRIHKGDNVMVIAGKDKGRAGKVLRALPRTTRVIVEGVNIFKKHQKPTSNNQAGGIINKTMPINVSNVMLVHPKTKKMINVYESKSGKFLRRGFTRIWLPDDVKLDSFTVENAVELLKQK